MIPKLPEEQLVIFQHSFTQNSSFFWEPHAGASAGAAAGAAAGAPA